MLTSVSNQTKQFFGLLIFWTASILSWQNCSLLYLLEYTTYPILNSLTMTLVYTDLFSAPVLVISFLYLHHFSPNMIYSSTLRMEVMGSTKTLVSICLNMQHHIPEDYNLDTRWYENTKCHTLTDFLLGEHDKMKDDYRVQLTFPKIRPMK